MEQNIVYPANNSRNTLSPDNGTFKQYYINEVLSVTSLRMACVLSRGLLAQIFLFLRIIYIF